ncbi:MAG: hypothetical protein JOZ55_00940 [Alphaproteobacteria bacterium]|nr:hypothetical protein [Alphaproteobacteria bacterium]
MTAVVVRAFIFPWDDISWLILLAERTLAGARPYVDFIEVNPPGAIILYLGPVALAHELGIRAELVISVAAFAGGLLSLWLAGKILLRAQLLERRSLPATGALAVAWLLLAPGNTYGQREHLALIAMLPIFAVHAVRAREGKPKFTTALLAGSGAGIAVAIKPYFALALFLTAGAAVLRNRGRFKSTLALLAGAETAAAGSILLAYALACLVWFRGYFASSLPLILDLYVKFRLPIERLIFGYATLFLGGGLLLYLLAGGQRSWSRPLSIFAVAALGFALGVYIQGKAFPYHSLPALLLLMFSTGCLLIERLWPDADATMVNSLRYDPMLAFQLALYLVLSIGVLFYFGFSFHPPKLFPEVVRLAPPHPRIAAISESLKGPQLARYLSGSWVERTPNSWIGRYAAGWPQDDHFQFPSLSPNERARIRRYGRMDRDLFVEAVRNGNPDVIFVEPSRFSRSRLADSLVVHVMASYRCVETIFGTSIWLRRNPSLGRPSAPDSHGCLAGLKG